MLTPVCLEVSISEAKSLIPTSFLEFNTSCLRSGKQSEPFYQLARWTLINFNPELNLLSDGIVSQADFNLSAPDTFCLQLQFDSEVLFKTNTDC